MRNISFRIKEFTFLKKGNQPRIYGFLFSAVKSYYGMMPYWASCG